ncbi:MULTISPECIES: DUF1254 domain-containing protein [unclassified Gordonia (in: high G+C Gram-positive bacteria)]|uniref:DUF1254 domain-containing protein n=2 Tax=Gordonia TaxID=2053 RepID=UPI0032E4C4E7
MPMSQSSRRRRALTAVVSISVALTLAACSSSTSPDDETSAGGTLSADETKTIVEDAYIYGYPLVTMDMTRKVMTNVAQPEGTRAPIGQFVRMRQYPTAAFRDVTAPNADTLYTSGWVDVGNEPWVLSLPDAHDRYYLFPMLDGYTNVFESPGKRTTGTGPQTYAITGPGWKGTLPDGVKEYKSPTSMVWLLGRIYCTGTPEDYAAVHKMQDEIKLTPLSSYGKPYTPPAGTVDPAIDMKTPVRDQVNNLSTEAFLTRLATLMKDNPPAEADKPIVEKMAKIGLSPGKAFDINRLKGGATAVESVPKDALGKIVEAFKELKAINGWQFTTDTGTYGTNYLQRATITYFGLGANLPQDAIYPTSYVDAAGQPYDGANRYTLHFEKGQLPPVNAFWSLTMYDADFFFVDNPLNRYTLSQRNKLVTNPDGSTDLYLQHENPGGQKEANWLPAPSDKFVLMLRLYWPKTESPSILNGTWKPPAVQKAD